MTIAEIIEDCIRETGGDTSDTDQQTNFLGFIKSTLRKFPKFVRVRAVISVYSGTLSSGSQSMVKPSGLIEERSVYRKETSGRRVEIINVKEAKSFNQMLSESTGKPNYYMRKGANIEFDYKADSDMTIYFEGYGSISNVQLTDEFPYEDDILEIVKDGAKMYHYDYEEDDIKSKKFENRFTGGLLTLEEEYAQNETPDYVEES